MKILIFCVVLFGILALTNGNKPKPKPKVTTKGCMMKCDKKWLGYYQSCDSCEGYVTCVWGHKYDRKCPGGLKWNDNHKGCDRTTPTCTEKN